jgi:DNA-damage-inducible protein J
MDEETIEAIKAARRGETVTAGKPENLLKSLNADC